jgi:hypothetical protein
MNSLKDLFEQQAEWQCDQANRPWAEKLRLSVVMREALLALGWPRSGESSSPDSDAQSKHPDR